VCGAIKAYYKVVPIKINVVRNPTKKVFIRGKKGIKAGVKKAYVYLKKGDKLE
jgi:ribosomal protein L23